MVSSPETVLLFTILGEIALFLWTYKVYKETPFKTLSPTTRASAILATKRWLSLIVGQTTTVEKRLVKEGEAKLKKISSTVSKPRSPQTKSRFRTSIPTGVELN